MYHKLFTPVRIGYLGALARLLTPDHSVAGCGAKDIQ